MSETLDRHVTMRYQILKRVGKGAYGIVFRAKDKKTDKEVALKKIFDAFSNSTDAQRTFREVMFLQEFQQHENIIRLHEILPADNAIDIYLIFDYMHSDLHKVIKLNILKDIHKKSIAYQIIRGLKYIHSGGVIHRDLKPSNILLDRNCNAKICDFGLARSVLQLEEDSTNPALTDYVATRWYRAPEILLGSKAYTKGVDNWSLGCIVAEMYLNTNGKSLFPGTDTFNQIERIVMCLPSPTEEEIDSLGSPYAHKVLLRQRSHNHVGLERRLAPGAGEDALDLMQRFLRWNPSERLSAADALDHSFVSQFHVPENEPTMSYDVVPPLDDNIMLTAEQYRDRLYKSMRSKNKRLCTTQNPHPRPLEPQDATTPTSTESSATDASQTDTPRTEDPASPPNSTRAKSTSSSSGEESSRKAKSTASSGDSGRFRGSQTTTEVASPSSSDSARDTSVHSRQVHSASAALAAAKQNLLERYGVPAGRGSTRGSSRYQPVAFGHSAIPRMKASQAWIDAKAQTEAAFAEPQKEAPIRKINQDDYMKSFSAPDLGYRSDPSPSSHALRRPPRAGPPLSGASHWKARAAGRQPEGRQITFNTRTQELHTNIIPGSSAAAQEHSQQAWQPQARIPRPLTKTLDDKRTTITRGEYGDRRVNTTALEPNGLLSHSAVPASRRPPSAVDAARRSAARKATMTVTQSATQSRRRQYTSENQFTRAPVGHYTASHGVISQSTLAALRSRK